MTTADTPVVARSQCWERQIICWLARLHARADGHTRPGLEHYRRVRSTLRYQERLNAETAAERKQEQQGDNHDRNDASGTSRR